MPNVWTQASGSILRAAPLFPVAGGLIAGITFDRFVPLTLPRVWLYVIVFIGISLIAVPRWMRDHFGALLVLVASICVGAFLHQHAARTIPPSGIERYVGESAPIARLYGRVISPPQVLAAPENPFGRWTYGSERTAFLLQVDSIEGVRGDVPLTGRVRVTVGEAVLDLSENERVEVFGRLHRFPPPRNPGAFDWGAFYRRQDVVAGMRCNHWENVRRLDADPPRGRTGFLTWLRTTARGMLTDDLVTGADEEASLLEAMVLGHRSGLDRRLNDVFIQAGCIHFLAVSGLHVGIVMFFAWLACRVVMAPPRAGTWVMMVAVIVYATVAEPRPPILRAGVMAVLYCIARLLGRPRAALNWLSAAAILLILLTPTTLFDAGFRLSFTAVLGVVYLSPALSQASRRLRLVYERVILRRPFGEMDRWLADRAARASGSGPSFGSRVRRVTWRLIVLPVPIAFGAWLASWPIVAVHFHRIHPWGPINSVLVLPLMSLVMLLGFVKIIAIATVPSLGQWISGALGTVDGLLVRVVGSLASLPGASMPASSPPWSVIVPYYLLLILFARRFRAHFPIEGEGWWPKPRSDSFPSAWLSGACTAALALCAVGMLAWWWPQAPGRLTVTFLDVGRASATVIELPDGKTILYDAGTTSPYDVGRSTVVPFLRHRGIARIDRVYLSHPNLDHFSGVPTILEEIPTGPIIVNRYFEPRSPPRSPSRHLLEWLDEREYPVQIMHAVTTNWDIGGVTFEYLSPPADLGDEVSTNDTSTVLRLSYAGHSILLTGDIEEHTQRALVDHGNLHADILVLPHHGAVRSTTGSFFSAVDPSLVIRSSNERMDETYSGLPRFIGATPVYDTADVGAIEVVVDPDGVRVSTVLGDRL